MKPGQKNCAPVTKGTVARQASEHGGTNVQAAGVRYITEDLIKRVTKQHNLEFITTLNLTLTQETGKKIKYIENLDKLKRLESLNLSCNQIEKISKLEKLTRLRELNLAFNYFSKIEGLEALVNLQVLNLSGNRIEHIPQWFGKKLKSLRTLRLAKNELSSLQEISKLRLLKDLIQLSVSENPICELPHCRLYIVFHLRTLEVLDGQEVQMQEREEARRRFEQEEIETLEQLLQESELRCLQLEDQHNRSILEMKDAESKQKELKQKEKHAYKKVNNLEQELETKNDLLKRKTAELTKACEKHYELEQELAFYKIDHKFASLGHIPEADGDQNLDSSGLIGESPYIGKARYKTNKFAFETSTPSQGQPAVMHSLRRGRHADASLMDEATRGKFDEALDGELIDKQRQIEHAEEKLRRLQDELEKREKQILRVTEELQRTAAMTPRRALSDPEKQKLQHQLSRKILNVKELRNEAANIEDELLQTRDGIKDTEETVNRLKVQLKRMGSRDSLYGKVKAEVADKEQQLRARSQLYDDLQRELDEMMQRIATETAGIKDLEKELTEGQAAINEEMKTDLENVIAGLQHHLADVQKQADRQKEEYDSLLAERNELRGRLDQMENEMSILDSEAGSFLEVRKKLQELQDSLHEEKGLNARLQDQMSQSALDTDLQDAQKVADRLRDELEQLQHKAQADKAQLKERLQENHGETDQLMKQLNAAKTENYALEKELRNKEEERQSETISPEELQHRIQQLLTNLEKGKGHIELYDDDDHVGALLADLEGHLVERMRQQNQETAKAKGKLSKIEAEMEPLRHKLSKVESKLRETTDSDRPQLGRENEQMRKQIDDLKNALNAARGQKGEKSGVADYQRIRGDHTLLPSHLLQPTPRSDGTSDKLQDSIQSMNSEDQALYERLQQELANLRNQMKHADQAANKKLQDSQAYIKTLEQALRRQEDELEHRRNKDPSAKKADTRGPKQRRMNEGYDDAQYPPQYRDQEAEFQGSRNHPVPQHIPDDQDFRNRGLRREDPRDDFRRLPPVSPRWPEEGPEPRPGHGHHPDNRVQKLASDLQRAEDEVNNLQQLLDEKQRQLEETLRQTNRSSHTIGAQQREITDLNELINAQTHEIERLNRMFDQITQHAPGENFEDDLEQLRAEINHLRQQLANRKSAVDVGASGRRVGWLPNQEYFPGPEHGYDPRYSQTVGQEGSHGPAQTPQASRTIPSTSHYGRGQNVRVMPYVQDSYRGPLTQHAIPNTRVPHVDQTIEVMPPGTHAIGATSNSGFNTIDNPYGGSGNIWAQSSLRTAPVVQRPPVTEATLVPAQSMFVAQSVEPTKGILKKTETEELFCNVPEHHSLEDYVAKLQQKIEKLKEKCSRYKEERLLFLKQQRESQSDQKGITALKQNLQGRKKELESLDLAVEQQTLNLKKLQALGVELSNSHKVASQELEELKKHHKEETKKQKRKHRERDTLSDSESDYNDDYDIERHEDRRAYLQDEIACLEETLMKRRAELKAADGVLEECEQDLAEARKQAHDTVKKFDSAQQGYNSTVQETQDLEGRAEEAGIHLLHAQEELDELKGQVKKLERQRNQLEMTVKEINKIIITRDVEFRNMDAKVKKSSKLLAVMEARHKTLEQEDAATKEDLTHNEQLLEDRRIDITRYEDQIHKAKAELERHDKNLGQINTELHLCEDTLNQRKTELNELVKHAKENAESLHDQIKDKEDHLSRLKDEEEQLKASIRACHMALQNIKEDIALEKDVRDDMIAAANKQRAELKKVLEMQNIEKSELETVKDLHLQKVRELEKVQAELREEKSELQILQKDVDKKSTEVAQIRDLMARENQSLEKATKVKEDLEDQISSISRERQLLDDNCKDIEIKTLQLKRQLFETEDSIVVRRNELDDLDIEIKHTKQDLENVKQDLEDRENDTSDLTEEIKEKKTELKKFTRSLTDTEDQYKHMQQKLELATSQCNDLNANLKRLRDEILESQQICEECHKKQIQKQEDLNSLVQEVEQYHAEAAVSKKNLHKVKKESEKEESHLLRLLQNSQVELENLAADVASKREELQQTTQALHNLKVDMDRRQHTENTISELETKLQNLELQLQRHNGKMTELTRSIQGRDEELQAIQKQYDRESRELHEICEQLRQDLNLKKRELKELKLRSSHEIEELESIAQEHCRRANRLSNELQSLQLEFMESKRQLMTQAEICDKENKLEQTLRSLQANIEADVSQGIQDLDRSRLEALEQVEDLQSQKQKLQSHLDELKENVMAIQTSSGLSTSVIAVTRPEEWKKDILREKMLQEQDHLKMQLRQQVSKHVEAIHTARQQSEGTLDGLQRKLCDLEDVLSSNS